MTAKQARWDKRYAETDLVWSATPNKTVEELVTGLEPGRALDLGCGEGRNSIWLAKQGWQVDALDFSAVGLDKARQLALDQGVTVDWQQADVSALIPDHKYDLVLAVFLHTSPAERQAWLSAAINRVAEAGYFLYVGHDPSNIAEGSGGPQDQAVLPDTVEIESYLSSFEVLQSEVIRRSITGDPGHGSDATGESVLALDAVVFARKGQKKI